MGSIPISLGPGTFDAEATVYAPTWTQDSNGAPTRVDGTPTSNVPCTIHASGSSESLKVGSGIAHESSHLFTGFFPAYIEGAALSIPAGARVVTGGVTYNATGAGNRYSDGVQRVTLEVVT